MRRARQVLGALVVVNALMLWFFAGAGASLGWHDRMLDDDTLRACGQAARGTQGAGWIDDPRDAEFAGPATVRFDATWRPFGDEPARPVRVECELGTRADADMGDPLEVLRAEVVR